MRSILTLLLLCVAITFSFSGCNRPNPGNWKQEDVEKELKERLKLTEIQLTAGASNDYSGTGKDAKGQSYKIAVSQFPAEKKMTYKADGDRGDIEEGKVEFK